MANLEGTYSRHELTHGYRETLPTGDRYVLNGGTMAEEIHAILGFNSNEKYRGQFHVVIEGTDGLFSVSARDDAHIRTFEEAHRPLKRFDLEFDSGTTIYTESRPAPRPGQIAKETAIIVYPDGQVGLYANASIALSFFGAVSSPPQIKKVSLEEGAKDYRAMNDRLGEQLVYLARTHLAEMDKVPERIQARRMEEFDSADRPKGNDAISLQALIARLNM